MTMLFLIDLQNDYFHEDGKFYFPESREIVGSLLERIQQARETGESILYTLNLYTDEDQRTVDKRNWASRLYEPFRETLEGHIGLKKIYYGLSAKDADRIRILFQTDPPETIEVAGVATNVCVLANAVIIQNLFPDAEIIIRKLLTRTEDQQLGDMTYKVMAGMNMTVKDE